jgi:hypothetical protein
MRREERLMSDPNRIERLQIMLTEEELRALDDWRFASRMPSRAAAVRELLRRGLAAEGVVLSDSRMRSQDFGVTERDAQGRGRAGSAPDGHGDPDENLAPD